MEKKVLIKGIIGLIIMLVLIIGDIWLFSSEYSKTGCIYSFQKAKLVPGGYQCEWDSFNTLFLLFLISTACWIGYRGRFKKK